MGGILKGIGAIIGLSILLALLDVPVFGMDTKTAYTRDGINFISKERMDENIKYEYAKSGDYREVQVPLNTIVVNASVVPQSVSDQVKQDTEESEGIQPSQPPQTALASAEEDEMKYPYAALGIGLLLIVGLVVFAAWVINGRSRQRR